jgi:two-component system sensor histidine kinase BaeS
MLARLVNDLRTLTLADAGRLTLHLQEVKLAALLERTVISFASQADARGVTLQLVVHDHERRDPLLIDVDPDRLAQVLTNVIDNAVHHTPEGGHIRLDARRAEAVIHIEVRDNGPGFREADVSKVFERFYRADTSRSRALGQGSGLGLALVKSITELHGGRVTAANVQNGTGAVIAIELPAPN